MNFNEKTLEDIIYQSCQTPEGRDSLAKRGLVISGAVYRQLNLGSFGTADLVSISLDPNECYVNITVYELKKEVIDEHALMQACRYMKGLKSHGFNKEINCRYRIVLIGDSVCKRGDFVYLYESMDFVRIYTYEFSLCGLMFKYVSKDWSPNEFKENKETKKLLTNYIKQNLKKLAASLKKDKESGEGHEL